MIKLSVIIPTRNRAKLLYNTLLSIVDQTLDQDVFEVIVCDNNSIDETEEITRQFEKKIKNLRYIKTINPGLHVGRNKGYLEAQGEIMVFADDDIEALPEWLFTINEVFRDKEIVLVGGKNLPKWEVSPPDWAVKMWLPNKNNEKVCHYFSIIDLGNDVKEIDPLYVVGCNFSVRKIILDKTKGFHPDGMPQELIEYRGDGETSISEYIKKNNYKTIYHPNASVYHLVSKERLTIEYLRKRGFNQGVSDSYTRIRSGINYAQQDKAKVKLFFQWLKSNLKSLVAKKTENDIYLKTAQNAIKEGYRDGYAFHQNKIEINPDIKAWVLKENYLE